MQRAGERFGLGRTPLAELDGQPRQPVKAVGVQRPVAPHLPGGLRVVAAGVVETAFDVRQHGLRAELDGLRFGHPVLVGQAPPGFEAAPQLPGLAEDGRRGPGDVLGVPLVLRQAVLVPDLSRVRRPGRRGAPAPARSSRPWSRRSAPAPAGPGRPAAGRWPLPRRPPGRVAGRPRRPVRRPGRPAAGTVSPGPGRCVPAAVPGWPRHARRRRRRAASARESARSRRRRRRSRDHRGPRTPRRPRPAGGWRAPPRSGPP